MNKLVKASVASAAGIALLMGGAGSLALWNDSATVSSGTVSTGELSLTSDGAGTWDNDIALWVPGDTDTYTEEFTVVATGDNIAAEISASYTAANTSGISSSSTIVVTGAGSTLVSPGVYSLDAGTYSVTVTVDVSFNATGTNNQNLSAVPLGDVSVTLQQV